jgi:peptide/nickel transport system substrate-binding protein
MAWKAQNRQAADMQVFERNPYYWKIDVKGNQLPYIDAIHRPYVSSEESVLQMALNGDVEFLDGEILGFSANYDILSENAPSGGYRLVTAPGWATMVGLIAFNYSHPDPVLRDLFLNRNFRTALSLGIDRDRINRQLFEGRYEPAQASPSDGPPYHGESPEFHRFIEYDPMRANEILDSLGLQWDRYNRWRLRSDGTPLVLASTNRQNLSQVDIAETIRRQWQDIGIQLVIKPVDSEAYRDAYQSGDYDILIGNANWGGRRPFIGGLSRQVLPTTDSWFVNPPWGAWATTAGREGMEPPAEYRATVQNLYANYRAFVAEPDVAVRTEIERTIYRWHADDLLVIGVLKRPYDAREEWYHYYNNRVKNVSDPAPSEACYSVPQQFFLE